MYINSVVCNTFIYPTTLWCVTCIKKNERHVYVILTVIFVDIGFRQVILYIFLLCGISCSPFSCFLASTHVLFCVHVNSTEWLSDDTSVQMYHMRTLSNTCRNNIHCIHFKIIYLNMSTTFIDFI